MKPQMSRKRTMLLSEGVNRICYISEHAEPTLISVEKNSYKKKRFFYIYNGAAEARENGMILPLENVNEICEISESNLLYGERTVVKENEIFWIFTNEAAEARENRHDAPVKNYKKLRTRRILLE